MSIVTFNDELFIGDCLKSLGKQTIPCRVRVFDNASDDSSCSIAGDFRAELVRSPDNIGFSAGHNQNLEGVKAEYIVLLNADTKLNPGFP